MKTILIISLSLIKLHFQCINAFTNNQCDLNNYYRPDIYYVKGTASANLEPTQAVVTLELEIKKEKAEDALQQTAEITEDVIKAIKETCKGELRIQTADFKIKPLKEYSKSKPYQEIFSGFQVKNRITVETLNTNDVGKIIDTAVKNKINKVIGIQFDVSNQEKKRLNHLLIQQAIEDAKHTANVVLKELNMIIESIKSVEIIGGHEKRGNTILSQQVEVGFVIRPIEQ